MSGESLARSLGHQNPSETDSPRKSLTRDQTQLSALSIPRILTIPFDWASQSSIPTPGSDVTGGGRGGLNRVPFEWLMLPDQSAITSVIKSSPRRGGGQITGAQSAEVLSPVKWVVPILKGSRNSVKQIYRRKRFARDTTVPSFERIWCLLTNQSNRAPKEVK